MFGRMSSIRFSARSRGFAWLSFSPSSGASAILPLVAARLWEKFSGPHVIARQPYDTSWKNLGAAFPLRTLRGQYAEE